jgi:hypothetical protein
MLTSVDTVAGEKTAELKIDGDTLEAMALDVYRGRMYVNDKAKNEVTVVDRWQNKIVAAWPITLGRVNVAMALDEPHQRLFVGCRSGRIVVLDTNTGKELQGLSVTKGIDDLAYDTNNKRLYAAGDGSVTVYREQDADHYVLLGTVPTAPLARTARVVPELNRYFVSVPTHDGLPASVLVFETVGCTPPSPAHETVAYTVHAPFAEELVRKTLSAHTQLRKMGLHAIAPGQTESVIIANGNATRVGIRTTEADFAAVKSGKTYCARKDDGSFYNMKMPMFDSSGRRIGILVMEIPYSATSGDQGAISMAEEIRSEMEKQIPDLASLFSAS